jgi:hypothetical protein
VRIWTKDGQRREEPSAWTQCSARPLIAVRSLWFMGTSYGVTLECPDVVLDEKRAPACPF